MTAAAQTAAGGVAITGMACLYPGAADVDAYWRNILGKVDSTSEPPPESWDPGVYYDPEFTDHDRTYCQRGGYLGDLATFEPLRYGVPPVSVGGEPDQWLALRIAHEALRDAGATDLPDEVRARTSVILGKGTYLNGGNAIAVQRGLVVGQTIDLLRRLHPEHSEEFLEALRAEMQESLPALGPETVPGLIPNIIVGRIANRLDLMGPAYTIDAACASSLVAIQHAVNGLLAGDCDLALTGGAQVWMPVATMNLFCRLGALSHRQRLRSFAEDADGTLLGEGIGMIVLKRLKDAVRDSDRIYAVIRGVGVSSDGRGLGVMAPRVEGEELALRRAYEVAGVSPASVGLIEAHGTGTPLGDATEIQALTRVFGERGEDLLARTAIGSVKSMISHTIPAAGVAGVIKAALALHQRVLPPTLADRPDPKLKFEQTPFYLNTETRPWIHGGSEPRRAGVNAFGFGGINAHAVLEEYDDPAAAAHRPAWDTELFILQAPTAAALVEQATELIAALESTHQFTLAQLAFTLSSALGRAESPGKRLAIVADSPTQLAAKLRQAIDKLADPACKRIKTVSGIYYESAPLGRDAKVVLVFPGEGSQYPSMLADLCLHFPEARAVFDRIDRLYADHPRGHLLSDWVFPRPAFTDAEREYTDRRLMELDVAVESVLTANAAVHAVLGRLVPRIDALVGHSTGEHSAAMAAGALDLRDEADLKRFCLGLNESYTDAAARHDVPGAVLLAVGAGADATREIADQAGGELYLAMDNCPHQAVLVGDADAAERARVIATGQGVICEQLPYDRAVHTPQFAPFAEDLREIFATLPVRGADTELWSCTTAAPYPDDPQRVRELMVEHWTSPVLFRSTIEALHDDGARVFIESGPRGNMTTFVQDILRGREFCAVAADNRRRSGVTQLNHVAGMLAVHDVELDLGYLFEHRATETVDWRAPAPPAAAMAGPIIPLSTRWPMISLSNAAIARLAESRPAVTTSPAPNEPVATPTPPPSAPTPAYREPVAAPAPTGAVAPDQIDAMIGGHLQTMERFLQSGAEVMDAYLSGAAPVLIEHARLPLLGEIVQWTEETELLTTQLLDLDHDLYLRHHTLGRAVSRTDPELTALAVVPLAISIEMLAEAGACLLPDLVVTGLRDVRAARWLAVGERPTTVQLHARQIEAPDGETRRVHVSLIEIDDAGKPSPVIDGTVLLANRFPSAPTPLRPTLDDAEPSRWAPDELYGEAMFHQPIWQGVAAIDGVAPQAASATLRALPRTGMLSDDDAPAFVLDPVLLDAAGQLIGFWAAQRLDRAKVVFPFRMAALDLHAPPPRAGAALSCAASIALQGDQLVSSDIDVVDAAGVCVMRIQGWEDKRYDVPERFRALSSPDRLTPLSSPWETPLEPYRDLPATAIRCRRLDARLGADAALWKQVWAARVLSRRERELFAALRYPEPRRLEWLAARTAGKEAVADLVRDVTGIDLWPAEIELLTDDRGAPVVVLPTIDGLEAAVPVVSLAHTAGEAVALAALIAPAPGAGRPGIDIERIAPRPPGFAEAALTATERDRLPPFAAFQTDEWLLRCWCAKEAAGKSAQTGFALGLAAPGIAAVHADGESVLVDVGGAQMTVHTRREGPLVLATTIGEKATQ
jgi:acyl transferase domain-containing protein/phosphopantetheinyl transferase (holo-ACP synthase)